MQATEGGCILRSAVPLQYSDTLFCMAYSGEADFFNFSDNERVAQKLNGSLSFLFLGLDVFSH